MSGGCIWRKMRVKEIVFKAMGHAKNKSVAVAEVIKIEDDSACFDDINYFVPQLDKQTNGYQAPVYVEQPRQQQAPPPQRQPRRPPGQQFQQLEYEDSYARGCGRGRGRGRGRGWGRGCYGNNQGGGYYDNQGGYGGGYGYNQGRYGNYQENGGYNQGRDGGM